MEPPTGERAGEATAQKRAVGEPGKAGEDSDEHGGFPLKVFVALMGLGLILSSLLGIYVAYQIPRERVSTHVLLLLGLVIPVAMLLV